MKIKATFIMILFLYSCTKVKDLKLYNNDSLELYVSFYNSDKNLFLIISKTGDTLFKGYFIKTRDLKTVICYDDNNKIFQITQIENGFKNGKEIYYEGDSEFHSKYIKGEKIYEIGINPVDKFVFYNSNNIIKKTYWYSFKPKGKIISITSYINPDSISVIKFDTLGNIIAYNNTNKYFFSRLDSIKLKEDYPNWQLEFKK